jgi:hypothetical protein
VGGLDQVRTKDQAHDLGDNALIKVLQRTLPGMARARCLSTSAVATRGCDNAQTRNSTPRITGRDRFCGWNGPGGAS